MHVVPISNILAERYASQEMTDLFDPHNRVRTERQWWLAVLSAQRDLGLEVAAESIPAYEAVIDQIDLESIQERERETRHDVKARLDEFCALAGFEDLHKGLTSRDATENVEQLLTWQALKLIEGRTAALLNRYAELAAEYATTVIVGRTHNVAAQPTTVGKRFAQQGEELLAAYENVVDLRARFAIRGVKGPVGSQQDQIDLLGGPEQAAELEDRLSEYLGVPRVLDAVGQVYPRSLDFEVVAALLQLGSAPANSALQIRLMAGHDLATEGFRPGQVGSSAMPHKMNTRSCERIGGLFSIIRGHLTMAANLAGDQWNEGDVSCSVVRRVVLPDSFLALDGLYETAFAVLNDFGVYPGVISAEVKRYLPFMATPTLLMHAVRNGMGREVAHELIKEHAVATALDMREGNADGSAIVSRLAADDRYPGDIATLTELVDNPEALLGAIDKQVAAVCGRIRRVADQRPESMYRGADIL